LGSRRSLLVLVAVVLAAVAATTVFVWARGIEARAFDDAELVEVFVAKADIPKGTPGEQAAAVAIKASKIPAKFRPSTALTDLSTIKGKVALAALSSNTVLVQGQFVEPRAAQVTFSQRIPAGNVAITVSVDQVHGVAGLLVPGDKVNILVADPSGNQRVLFQNVGIIAIGTTAAPEPGETQQVSNPGSGLITFAVPPEAASRIAFAASQGGLYLTLVPQDNPVVDIPPINAGNVFAGARTPS
jgi:pilus assembly protein CpaB